MKNKPQRKGGPARDYEPVIVKAILAALFILSVAMIVSGVTGSSSFSASGYDSEEGYACIYEMSREVRDYQKESFAPAMDALDDAQREAVNAKLGDMLIEYWGELSGSADTAQAEAGTFIASLPEGEQGDAAARFFTAAFAVDGPKVSSKIKKQLAPMTDAERGELRTSLLCALIDEATALPQIAADAVGDAQGTERERMLLQLFLVSANEESESVPTELANSFKKSIRKDPARLDAYQKTVAGSVSWIGQFVVSSSRTVIMLGILLALDVVLLFLLMLADHSWHFDFKWIAILLIVDFMLLFMMSEAQ